MSVVELKNVSFRYESNGPNILTDVNFALHEG